MFIFWPILKASEIPIDAPKYKGDFDFEAQQHFVWSELRSRNGCHPGVRHHWDSNASRRSRWCGSQQTMPWGESKTQKQYDISQDYEVIETAWLLAICCRQLFLKDTRLKFEKEFSRTIYQENWRNISWNIHNANSTLPTFVTEQHHSFIYSWN